MRTTIDINDELLRAVKAHAAGERKTPKATIEHGCEWATLGRGSSIHPGLRSINLLDG